MKTAVDQTGAIPLPEGIRTRLGLRPGDEVFVREQAGSVLITPVTNRAETGVGLHKEGNVLVHEGTSPCTPEEVLEQIRRERFSSAIDESDT